MRPWVAFALAAMSAAAAVLIWKADEFGKELERKGCDTDEERGTEGAAYGGEPQSDGSR